MPVSASTPSYIVQRFDTARYGSMLNPGVGSAADTPAPAVMRVADGSVLASPTRARPTCRLIATGIRLPPMTRNAPLAPYELNPSSKPSGVHVAKPTPTVRFPSPTDPRAPNAVPLP